MSDHFCTKCGRTEPEVTFRAVSRPYKGKQYRMRTCRPCELVLNAQYKKEHGQHSERGKTKGLIVGLFDVHIEEVCKPFWAAIIKFLRDHRIDELILGGDFLEFASASSHGGTQFDRVAFERDLDIGRRAIRELRLVVGPDCKMTYLEGNHETRANRVLSNIAPAMSSRFSLQEELMLPESDVKWIPEDPGIYDVGNLRVIHGHQLRASEATLYPARKLAEKYGAPGRTVVCGHFHRRQVYEVGHVDGNRTGMCVGAVRDVSDVKWLHGERPGWCNQLLIAKLRKDGIVDLFPTTWNNGFWWGGTLYTG